MKDITSKKPGNCVSISSPNGSHCSPLYFTTHDKKRHLYNLVENTTIAFHSQCAKESLQNDLVVDWDFNWKESINWALSEEGALINLLQGQRSFCSRPMELPCLDGHPKCFIITQICVFSLNSCGHTHPCRNGGHMEECSDFECTTKFKCTNSYCIPWTYVCDNKWDCPKGEDELFQHICGTNKSICVGMFRCWKTLSCIHSGSVCDGYIDCPSGDDEQFCQLKTIQCPEQCFCLAFVILCQEDHTELILYPVVAIKITNSPHVIQYIDKFKVCIILEIQNSNISDKDMPFHVSAPLLCLHIQHNKLRTIPPNSFCENVVLKTLNLSWNQIQVLLSESFNCLRGLVLLPCQVIL